MLEKLAAWSFPLAAPSLLSAQPGGTALRLGLLAPTPIRCRARRTVELNEFHNNANSGHVSIRCRARRTADPFALLAGWQGPPGVSIRCCERRTVERSYLWVESSRSATFLFAVVRDVQRNTSRGKAGDSLAQILFVVVQDVQRNVMMMCQSNDEKTQLLFAVARDVQRNSTATPGSTATPRSTAVSIRCRARRTAEPYPLRHRR